MTVTVTPTVEASNVPPRVRLNISASAGETSTTVTRLDADGNVRTVRTADGAPQQIISGSALLYDYELPYGLAASYSSIESPATTSAQVTVDESRVWLVHPGVPDLSIPIEFRIDSFDAEDWDVDEGVFYPMARSSAVVQTPGVRRSAESSFTVAVSSQDELRALRDILTDTSSLLLNVPVSLGIGVDACYIAVGKVRNARPSNIGTDPLRDVVLPYRVVDRPAGGSQSQRTYTDILAGYASYAAVQAQYPSYLALLAGP